MFYEIKDSEIGNTSKLSLITSNIGHCLSITSEDEVYDKLFEVAKSYTEYLVDDKKYLSKKEIGIIVLFAMGRYRRGGSMKNTLNINYHMMDKMVEMLSNIIGVKAENQKETIFSRFFTKRKIQKFYLTLFEIYGNASRDRNMTEFMKYFDEISHY